jgi:hypothetical protein
MESNNGNAPSILFLGERDDANLCNRAARAINLLAGAQRARVWTLTAHPYGYPEDLISEEPPPEALGDWDWICSTGDGDYKALARMMAPFDGRVKNVAMTHSGSAYRGNPTFFNRIDAVFGASLQFIGSDSLHLADAAIPAVPWFSTCDDIEPAIEPAEYELERVTVAHSPSDRGKKGTDEILEALGRERADIIRARIEFAEDGIEGAPPEMLIDLIDGVSYDEARSRRARAQIFVDQLNPAIGGFGASAIEAMAAGCVVLGDTRNMAPDRAWERVGLVPPPIIEVRSAEELEGEIDELLRHEGDLYWGRQASLDWVREFAAPIPFARYFLRMLAEHAR